MNLSSGACDGHVVVALRGELDLVDAAAVAAALKATAARNPRLIVDLAGLEFIDASGVTALAQGRRRARHAGGELLLAAPRRLVRRVLEILWTPAGGVVYASVAAAASAGAAPLPAAPTEPANEPAKKFLLSALGRTDRRIQAHQKQRSSTMRWQLIAVHAAAPKRCAITRSWLRRSSWTGCERPPTYGGISG